MKCVVSGCPNRPSSVGRGIINRPPKRFFSLPEDPTRVKVWLAALRETDKQDSVDQYLICEDHFLPEDISKSGISSDAIPIMPPCLDGDMGMMGAWAEEEEEEENLWGAAAGDDGGGEEDEEEEKAVTVKMEVSTPEPPEPPKQESEAKRTSETIITSPQHQSKKSRPLAAPRQDVSLGHLTERFLEMLLAAPGGTLDLHHVAVSLKTRRRRVYDITNVLDGIGLIRKESASVIKWTGKCSVVSFLRQSQLRFQRELQNLKLVEETLDTLIKSCAKQLFDMTDDAQNARAAYITHEDVSRLDAFQEQTVLLVKAPEETKLEVPAPREDSIQMLLKGEKGPISVRTCDVDGGVTSGCFVTLEESRIHTSPLHTESSNTQSATQSA
ncbi:transcription factor E2F6 isoform X2 [Salarias fasciatus]|uniref:transcription factor E2F6 isoform X2 n=1 Tax=Salarias fasciatus TaxID=181472 RepID=UPI001176FCA4|nr:transcription factor E2F6-like isoform X2 [Salarias fasciatus]